MATADRPRSLEEVLRKQGADIDRLQRATARVTVGDWVITQDAGGNLVAQHRAGGSPAIIATPPS